LIMILLLSCIVLRIILLLISECLHRIGRDSVLVLLYRLIVCETSVIEIIYVSWTDVSP